MSENEILYRACVFAIEKLIANSSSSFAYRDENGKWQSVPWRDILKKIKVLEQKPCEDCISRQGLLNKSVYVELANGNRGYVVERGYIEDLPPVQPARRKGKWILAENGWNTVCDCCRKGKWKGYIPTPEQAAEWMPICPQCGADMREEKKDESDTEKN